MKKIYVNMIEEITFKAGDFSNPLNYLEVVEAYMSDTSLTEEDILELDALVPIDEINDIYKYF